MSHKQDQKNKSDPRQSKVPTSLLSHRLLGILLMSIGVLAIMVFGFVLLLKFFSAPRLATILPQNNTVAFAELDTGIFNKNFKKFRELTANYQIFGEQNLAQIINGFFGLNFFDDIKPWLGGRAGLAILRNTSNTGPLSEVIFIETTDQEKSVAALKKLSLSHPDDQLLIKKIGGFDVYSYKIANNLNFFFAKNYLIISDSLPPLQQIISLLNGEKKSISRDPEYNNIITNIDKNSLLFAYFDLQNSIDKIGKNPRYARIIGGEISSLMPLLKIFNTAGISLTATETGLRLQTYTSINKNLLKSDSYFSYQDNYRGKLLGLASPTALAVFGGHNFGGQINRFLELLEETNAQASLIFKGEINNVLKGYLGGEFLSAAQIFSYLNNEYVLIVEGSVVDPSYNLVIELDKEGDITPILPALGEAFTKYAANRSPIIRDIVLEDGTMAKEMVLDKSSISKTESSLYGGKMLTYSDKTGANLLSYMLIDNYLVIGHNRDRVTEIIKLLVENRRNKTVFDTPAGRSLLSSSDEVSSIKVKDIWPSAKFLIPEQLEYFLPFKTIYSGKQIFDNGVVTEYFLEINDHES